MGIVNNIKGTQGEWEVENAIGAQHQLAQFGNCKFSILGLNKKGNIDFNIGAQDIINIITTSIQQFGGSGKVGSKGRMDCRGTVNSRMLSGVFTRRKHIVSRWGGPFLLRFIVYIYYDQNGSAVYHVGTNKLGEPLEFTRLPRYLGKYLPRYARE